MGPFYCPEGFDDLPRILSFFRDLKTRYGAPGEFAEAYVIASRGPATMFRTLWERWSANSRAARPPVDSRRE